MIIMTLHNMFTGAPAPWGRFLSGTTRMLYIWNHVYLGLSLSLYIYVYTHIRMCVYIYIYTHYYYYYHYYYYHYHYYHYYHYYYHFKGFDSNIILIFWGGILMPMGNCPESLSQQILARRFLVWRLAAHWLSHLLFCPSTQSSKGKKAYIVAPLHTQILPARLRGWRNRVGYLIELFWLRQTYHRPHFMKNRGVWFHRIRNFKQHYFNSIPPTQIPPDTGRDPCESSLEPGLLSKV